MPFTRVYQFDTSTFANNSDIDGSNIAEGCAPSSLNNALLALCGIVRKDVAAQGSDITSASSIDLGAATGQYVNVTGTTTITALGTVAAGVTRWVEFTGALTLTHNATSLKLPGATNITTAAGDVGCFVSLGSGNWKCLGYWPVSGSSVVPFTGTLTSTDAGATEAPDFIADRNSATPAANDIIGAFVMRGRDSGANATDYAKLRGKILDPTNASEDGAAIVSAFIAGTETDVLTIGPGVQIGAPTGGNKGAGTLNVDTAIYIDGNGVAGPVYIIADQKTSGTNGGGITSGSFVKRTLNTEILDEIGITTTSSVMALSAGTYKAKFSTLCYAVDNFAARLRDTTNNVDLVLGQNSDAPAGNPGVSLGCGYFVLSGSANVELQVRVTVTNSTDGCGQATSFGTETYSIVYIEKVA